MRAENSIVPTLCRTVVGLCLSQILGQVVLRSLCQMCSEILYEASAAANALPVSVLTVLRHLACTKHRVDLVPSKIQELAFLQLAFGHKYRKTVSGDAAVINFSYLKDKNGDNGSGQAFLSFCAAYNRELSKLPAPSDPPKWIDFRYGGSDFDLCDESYPIPELSNKFLGAPRHNCSAYEQGMVAQKYKASGLIIASTRMFLPGQPNTTLVAASNFPILILKKSHMEEIEELPFSESWQVSIYAIPDSFVIDGSGIILLLVAVAVITIGSFRSGKHRFHMIEETHSRITNAMEPNDAEDPKRKIEADRVSVSFGPVAVVVFALFMACLLVLMYYFYDYLVYFFIGLFVIGATSGMYECFKPVLSWTEFLACRIPLGKGAAKCCGPNIDIRGVFLLAASFAMSITWVVLRNASYGWIFLDILGSFLLISVLIGIQLPSLKSATIFLCLLFIYDVFFVFITPYFTKDGQSVMIQVATGGYDPTRDSGGGSREVIPAAFKIPHIPTGSKCEDLFEDASYSLLGFGDVMVPGFLISYLRSFELVTGAKPIYSVSACFAYLVSLLVTTAALILMRTGQPALLYIVPILLSTVFTIAWRRREVKSLWIGNLSALYVAMHSSQLEPAGVHTTAEDLIVATMVDLKA